MIKKALVVGIDEYENFNNLDGCVNDAIEVAERFKYQGDEAASSNYEVKTLVEDVSARRLLAELNYLFKEDADSVVFYFAGHGMFDESSDFGYIVSQEGRDPSFGVNLDTIANLASAAYPSIKSSVIILDCCYSGQVADGSRLNNNNYAKIGTGVTILTASTEGQLALETEDGSHGLFTSILLDGLDGAAADVLGDVTAASLYSHVDRTLGNFEQRPLYKANVKAFTSLRRVKTEITKFDLCKLPSLFNSAEERYMLGPMCEPMKLRGDQAEVTKHIPFDQEEHDKYKFLQKLRNNRIVAPNTKKDMYWEAVKGWSESDQKTGSCSLTKLGQHYLFLAKNGKFGRPIEIWESS